MGILNRIKLFLKSNWLIVLIFVLSTIYFMYLHHIHVSWDFISYVLNAKYFAGQGAYFEMLRPPLVPFSIFLLSFLKWKLTEYAFIFLASLLFVYSITRLAKKLSINKALFYSVLLSPFVLNYGLINGSELLSVSLIALSITYLVENNILSGLFLGLSSLARYTGIFYFPLLFLNKKRKKIIMSFLLFILIIGSWFVYNYFTTGNIFSSIANQYALNYIFRQELIQPANILHFGIVFNYYIFFVLIGLFISLKKLILEIKPIKKSFFAEVWNYINKFKVDIIFLILFIHGLYTYFSLPIKNERFMFVMVLAIGYYTIIAIKFIVKKIKKYYKQINLKKLYIWIALGFILLNLAISLIVVTIGENHKATQYIEASKDIKDLGFSNCSLMSNSWVILNYYGQESIPYPSEKVFQKKIDDGEKIIIFHNIGEPKYVKTGFLDNFSSLLKKDSYTIFGNTDVCLEKHDLDTTYLEKRKKNIFEIYNYYPNVDPCYILFQHKPFLEKFCNFVNFKGFISSN